MSKKILFGVLTSLLFIGAGCEDINIPVTPVVSSTPVVQTLPEVKSTESTMPFNDPDARYILVPVYNTRVSDPTSADFWYGDHSLDGYKIQYIKNNKVVQEMVVRSGTGMDRSTLHYRSFGQDVRVTGALQSETVQGINYCFMAPCPQDGPYTITYMELTSIENSPRPFSLDDPEATYTLRENGTSGMWYVVYTKGDEIPRIIPLTTIDSHGSNIKEKSPGDPAPYKDKHVRIIGSVVSDHGQMFIRPEKFEVVK